jgi:hypothetical protein
LKARELTRRGLVLLLRPRKQCHEPRALSKRIEPRIAGHGGVAEQASADYALEKLQRGVDLVQVRQLACQVQKGFGVAERGMD